MASWLASIQRQCHDADVRHLRIALDAEAELATHRQHHTVVAQNLALDAPQTLAACVANDQLHQLPAEPVALEVGAQENGVFAGLVIGIGVNAYDAEQVSGTFANGREGHGTPVIDVCEPSDKGVAEILDRREE